MTTHLAIYEPQATRFGAVVDFIQWHAAGFYWPAFNIADSAITVGAVLLVFSQFTAAHPKEDSA